MNFALGMKRDISFTSFITGALGLGRES